MIFGSAIDDSMGDEIRVTLVATGLDRPLDPEDMRPPVDTRTPQVFPKTMETEAQNVAPVVNGPSVAGQQPVAETKPVIEPEPKAEDPSLTGTFGVGGGMGFEIPDFLRSKN